MFSWRTRAFKLSCRRGNVSVTAFAWNAVLAATVLFISMGVTTALLVELGVVRQLPPRWRTLIGMRAGEQVPSRPRIRVLVAAAIWLVVAEAIVFFRFADAFWSADGPSTIVLLLHFVAFLAWLTYLWTAREEMPGEGS